MLLETDSKATSIPGGKARQEMAGLPVLEYSMPINYDRA